MVEGSPAKPTEPQEPIAQPGPGRIVHVSLTDRQLADFFAAPAGGEGAFGNGAAFSSRTLSQPQ
jgi:hypothetical protein